VRRHAKLNFGALVPVNLRMIRAPIANAVIGSIIFVEILGSINSLLER
jgi:hypothetical protein